MRSILFFLFLISNLYAQDYGDGSDGSCIFNGVGQVSKTWNCTDLTVTASTAITGATAPIIKVTGDVIINTGATLSVAGTTVTAGPGGSDGGDCTSLAASACNNVNGSGTGAGNGGGIGNDAGNFAGAGGGGGAGGTYNGSFPGVNGVDDNLDPDYPSGGPGTTIGTIGTANTTGYGSESTIDTSLLGGSGGGAGGAGEDSSGGPGYNKGGDGGGGGGAIAIIAQGTITIDGAISANGGAAGNGLDNGNEGTGGGGGGGSGGGIYLYSPLAITINGSVTATGGAAGNKGTGLSGTYFGGKGGAGGKGRIRIDSISGSYQGSGTVDPTPYQVATGSSTSGNVFDSDIAYGCVNSKNNYFEFLLTFIFGLFIALGLRQGLSLVTHYHQ